ncbi:MAG: PASTA domain-containing protein [Myxococcales bacterium]|nr:PASTA domain-containing protein [Myxococcales bacterium]MCB9541311.1 PASTA domain-containing protein [Myxococcales bacterium]
MALTIRARIVDARGAARASITVRANRFDAAGNAIQLGSAVTAADGRCSIASAWTISGDYQPRVGLQVTVGRELPATVLAAPRSFAATTVDFGDVVYDPEGEATARDAVVRLAAVEAEYSATTARYEGELATLSRSLDEAGARIEAADAARAEAAVSYEAQIATLTQQLEAAQATAEAAAREPAAAPAALAGAAPAEVSIQRLAQGTAEQLQATQAALAGQRGGFTLGSVSLELKVMPGATEGGVTLPGAREAEAIDAAALSTLRLDFHPTAAPQTAAGLTVPALAGYTEALARRKLAERRLRAEVVARLVHDDRQIGRVVFQSPPAGAAVAEGATVVFAIGRKG